jgi:hypothetical protein
MILNVHISRSRKDRVETDTHEESDGRLVLKDEEGKTLCSYSLSAIVGYSPEQEVTRTEVTIRLVEPGGPELERSHDELRGTLIRAGRYIQRQRSSARAKEVLKRLRATLRAARTVRKRLPIWDPERKRIVTSTAELPNPA